VVVVHRRRERGCRRRERGGISQKILFFLICNEYKAPIFIVPNELVSQATTEEYPYRLDFPFLNRPIQSPNLFLFLYPLFF
jgi:hypothetical protein